MAKVRVKLNIAGFRSLRNDPAVLADLRARAERLAAASGPGYFADAQTGKNRARAGVVTGTWAAQRDNARNNTLINNLGAAR